MGISVLQITEKKTAVEKNIKRKNLTENSRNKMKNIPFISYRYTFKHKMRYD